MAEKNFTATEVAVAKSLIAFYNAKAGCAINSASKANQETVFETIDFVQGDLTAIKSHIKTWTAENGEADYPDAPSRFKACFAEVPKPEVLSSGRAVADSLNVLENAVAEVIAKTQAEQIKEDIMGKVQDTVRDFIKSEYGTIERKIVTIVDGNKRELKGVLHEKFDEVLAAVSLGIPVYLVGPAGSGKNVLCKQVADALGLKFYFTNAVTQEYKLTGFTDAMGNYQPTQFYKAFTEGGLFMLDEMDASIPEVLTILNAAIANKYFDFPAPIGYKEAHPNFRVIAAGNTSGNGADFQYVGRNQLDGASTNRFVYEDVDYSPIIEDSLALDKSLADFCREFRRAAKTVGVNIIVSYRAIEYLTKLIPIMPMDKALKMCLVKDLEKDDLHNITNELRDTPYKQALNAIYSRM